MDRRRSPWRLTRRTAGEYPASPGVPLGMNIAVLGTGMVGKALAARLAELDHTVTMGSRDPAAHPDLAAWADQHGVALATFAEAAGGAEVVLNATNGARSSDAVAAAGEGNLAGKVLIDVANPLDFSAGFPPTLLVKDTDSLAEQLQRQVPSARVVKALNTVTADVMVHPEIVPGEQTVFVCGNDEDAKRTATNLLHQLGQTDVFDLGDLSAARGAEMYLPLWLRIMGRLGYANFGIKVVR